MELGLWFLQRVLSYMHVVGRIGLPNVSGAAPAERMMLATCPAATYTGGRTLTVRTVGRDQAWEWG